MNGTQGAFSASTLNFNDGDATKQMTRINITGMTPVTNANPTESFAVSGTTLNAFDAQVIDRLGSLEKGQLLKNIDSGSNHKCVQPSLHVGISPVPRLTSAANTILPNSWTDVQSYYEIHAECWVEAFSPHHNTHQSQFHVETHDIKMGVANSTISSNYPVRFGKYAQTLPALARDHLEENGIPSRTVPTPNPAVRRPREVPASTESPQRLS